MRHSLELRLCASLVLLAGGCQQPLTSPKMVNEAQSLPMANDAISSDIYHLRVSHAGKLDWNGQLIDETTLQNYLRDFAQLGPKAGRLSVEFEPGSTPARQVWVRERVINSGLCRQKRCVEARWGIPTSLVN